MDGNQALAIEFQEEGSASSEATGLNPNRNRFANESVEIRGEMVTNRPNFQLN